MKKGDKALIGNSAYRRYLRKVSDKDKRSFAIDAGKLAEEARFDGVFVPRVTEFGQFRIVIARAQLVGKLSIVQ